MDVVLTIGESDPFRENNEYLSRIYPSMTPVEQVVQMPFCQGLPAEALRELAAESTVVALERGATLISQHEAAEHVFF
jgi:hypothetical protein